METPSILRQIVDPWYDSLADPKGSQERVLMNLISAYAKTDYGREHCASEVRGVADFRARFPAASFRSLVPYVRRVEGGDYSALLPEPAKLWVMTRGSTGASKVLPVTETHLAQILEMGARCVVNFATRRNPEVLEAAVLNLNFPSEVHVLHAQGRLETYGYSSGTYARAFPSLSGARLVPEQREIDSLGGGITQRDWERRFELAYERAKGEDIGSLMGVTPVMSAFASYLRKKHGVRPRQVWKPRALFCTSVAKIHTRYERELRYQYGPVPVVEMYTATEGVFAQQLDDLPYVSPNYDGYLFEVATGSGVKMLHELRPNEWGRLLVSTVMLPRYQIGDLVEALGKGYFRIFGRDRARTRLEHAFFNLLSFRF
ncbi:MAG TPA: GH3 auxin-responsive promoter family protein [Nitrososphaerales archaeon]|nr:GH3 auxin-responsive promoter family protein [Nitrososphaerales archaeon]